MDDVQKRPSTSVSKAESTMPIDINEHQLSRDPGHMETSFLAEVKNVDLLSFLTKGKKNVCMKRTIARSVKELIKFLDGCVLFFFLAPHTFFPFERRELSITSLRKSTPLLDFLLGFVRLEGKQVRNL